MLHSGLEFALTDPLKQVEDALEASRQSEIIHYCTDELNAAKVTFTMIAILTDFFSLVQPVLLVIYLQVIFHLFRAYIHILCRVTCE